MAEPNDVVGQIRSADWRQGSVCRADAAAKLVGEYGKPFINTFNDADWLIVTSHDCDIANGDLQKEPWAELLLARGFQSKKFDSTCERGRNSRKLQFEGMHSSAAVKLQASVHERIRVARALLAESSPDPSREIHDATRNVLNLWLAKRYIRAAFPDRFNERLKPCLSKVRDFFTSHGNRLKYTFLHVEPMDELADDAAYNADVALVCRAGDLSADDRDDIKEALVERLSSAEGIHADVRIYATNEFTLEMRSKYEQWDFDDISFADGSEVRGDI